MELKRSVERGIELLDARRPGWEHVVDPEDLDMQSPRNCMLGLLYGTYIVGTRQLGLTHGKTYGFTLGNLSIIPHENRLAWKELRRLWVEEIELRRLAAEAATLDVQLVG